MIGFLASILTGFLLALILERAEEASVAVIEWAASTLTEPVASQRREQWLADVSCVEGPAWKLLSAFGIVWICRTEIVEANSPLRFKKKYAVLNFEGPEKKFSIAWLYRDTIPCAEVLIAVMIRQIEAKHGNQYAEEFLSRLKARSPSSRAFVSTKNAYVTNILPVELHARLDVENGNVKVRWVDSSDDQI